MCLTRITRFLAFTVALIPACIKAQEFSLPPKVECGSLSQANDIYAAWPNNATGILNGTLAILPLPLETVRSIVPPQYQILTRAYRDLLPGLKDGYYPALIELMHDHDVRFGSVEINDFSKASIGFPFVDLLGDGYTSFRWTGKMLVSEDNGIAINGIGMYGTEAIPAKFTPSCNAYDADGNRATNFGAQCQGSACISSEFRRITLDQLRSETSLVGSHIHPSTLYRFFANTTNQPIFGDGKVCDNQIRVFDTLAKDGSPWHLTPVRGSVVASSRLLDGGADQKQWDNLLGMRAPSRFIENNALSCQSLQGYSAHTVAQQLGGRLEGSSMPMSTVNASVTTSTNPATEISTSQNATKPEWRKTGHSRDDIAREMKYRFAASTALLSTG